MLDNKILFTVRLRVDQIEDIKLVANFDKVTKTSIVEAALDNFLPERKEALNQHLQSIENAIWREV